MSKQYFIDSPEKMTLKEDVKFAYCSCGLSETFPLCNGNHRGTEFKPIKITPNKDTTVMLCRCGKSKTKPKCDNSHLNGDT
ncbi:MAG: CDGSH iron-sulfur domain-containing protein [Campylobacterota bacterium]|nr:CDGSH iron-sulfur domain-containing protein [Campylobacterota bacterium]